MWERLFFMLFLFIFPKTYFYYKIESIWVILALLLIWVRFFSFVFGIVVEDGMRNVGFPGLLAWGFYSGLSIIICHCEKQPVTNSGYASNWTLATRTQRTTPFSKRVSTPVCIFVHQHLKCSLKISKPCHRVLQSPLSVTGFFISNMNSFLFGSGGVLLWIENI